MKDIHILLQKFRELFELRSRFHEFRAALRMAGPDAMLLMRQSLIDLLQEVDRTCAAVASAAAPPTQPREQTPAPISTPWAPAPRPAPVPDRPGPRRPLSSWSPYLNRKVSHGVWQPAIHDANGTLLAPPTVIFRNVSLWSFTHDQWWRLDMLAWETRRSRPDNWDFTRVAIKPTGPAARSGVHKRAARRGF